MATPPAFRHRGPFFDVFPTLRGGLPGQSILAGSYTFLLYDRQRKRGDSLCLTPKRVIDRELALAIEEFKRGRFIPRDQCDGKKVAGFGDEIRQ